MSSKFGQKPMPPSGKIPGESPIGINPMEQQQPTASPQQWDSKRFDLSGMQMQAPTAPPEGFGFQAPGEGTGSNPNDPKNKKKPFDWRGRIQNAMANMQQVDTDPEIDPMSEIARLQQMSQGRIIG
jgi:hypothetical protein